MLQSHPCCILMLFLALVMPIVAHAQGEPADERARATEAKMTDDERFSLIISLFGAVPALGVPRDKRIPPDVPPSTAFAVIGMCQLPCC